MAEETRWGTVFMGPTVDRESRLDKISNREEQDMWNRRTEAEYLRRVKERAVEQLNAMLSEAQEQAAGLLAAAQVDAENIQQAAEALRAEALHDREAAATELENARNIRDAAYDEGYNRGVEQAMLELEEQRGTIDATTLAVIKAIEDQCGTLFASWRDELAALLRQSVETATCWILDEERAAILENLLCKAVETLENQRRISVRANPVDVPAVEEVLNSVRGRFSELKAWDVKSDDTLSPGGLVVESVSGRVESLTESRREIVEQTLRHLTLPESAADIAAAAEVHAVGERSGVPELEQTVFEAEQKAQALEALQAELHAQAEAEEADRLAAEQLAAEQLAAEQSTDSSDMEEFEGIVEDADLLEDADLVEDTDVPEGVDLIESEGLPPLQPKPESQPASESATPPRPTRPTPKNPAMVALPEGSGSPDLSDAGLSAEEAAEFDRKAKEIAHAMMFGDAVTPNSSAASETPDDSKDDDDLDTPMSDEELLPDFATMTPEEVETYTRKHMEPQD